MSATIHTLFGSGEGHAVPEADHPLYIDLRKTIGETLDGLLGNMFSRADDALFQMGERASSDSERRRYFDTMRILRIDQSGIRQAFTGALSTGYLRKPLQQSLAAGDIDLDELSIQPTEELEERIATANLISRAEGIHGKLIWQIERRLLLASQITSVPFSEHALSPSRICEAFSKSIAGLKTEFQIKLIIYKLFEREVVNDLNRVYEVAVEVFDRNGIGLQAPVSRHTAPVAPPGPAGFFSPPQGGAGYGMPAPPAGYSAPAPGYGGGYAPPQLPQGPTGHYPQAPAFDPALIELLRPGLPQAQLSPQVMGLLEKLLSGTYPQNLHLEAPAQRLTLANQYFDSLVNDSLLPQSARNTLETLRLPVMRTAITDPEFFKTPAHPLRKLLAELMDLAVTSAITDSGGSSGAAMVFNDMVRQIAHRTDAQDHNVNQVLAELESMKVGQFDQFLNQMRSQERSRRSLLMAKVRKLVSEELEVQTVGRQMPSAAQTLLRSGIGPLMAFNLLRHGRESSSYQSAHSLMERVLNNLDSASGDDERQMERESLCKAISDALDVIGMRRERIDMLLVGLREAFDELDEAGRERQRVEDERRQAEERAFAERQASDEAARAAMRAVATARMAGQTHAPEAVERKLRDMQAITSPISGGLNLMDLLSRILLSESWFRVFDPHRNTTRWLKLALFYPQQDSVAFSGFDEGVKLSMRAQRFANDLAQGRSEPINPTESARQALEALREAKANGLL